MMRMKREKKEKENERSGRRPKARQTWWKIGKWLFVLLILGQNWLGVSDAAEGPQRRTEEGMRMQQEVQIKERTWAEATPQRWNQAGAEDRTEMKKEVKLLRCTLLKGSAWSTEKRYMRRYTGKCDIFFWEKHRLREEVEEQFNR